MMAFSATPNAAAGESMTLPRLDPRKRKALRLFGRRKCPSLMNSSAARSIHNDGDLSPQSRRWLWRGLGDSR